MYKIGHTYAFMRKSGDTKYLVVVNPESVHRDIRLDVARYNVNKIASVLSTDYDSSYTSGDGIFFIKTEPYSVTVYKCD